WRADSFRRRVEEVERHLPSEAWPTYTLSNHDHSRHATRYGEGRVKAAALLLLALRGTPFLYYGEELGMPGVPEASGQDPVGRDPERTPMRWTAGEGGGFTTGAPWLPLCPPRYNVADQQSDPDSTLSFYRRLIAVRRNEPALHSGSQELTPAPDGVLSWRRGSEFDVLINMGDETVEVTLSGTVELATRREREGERVDGPTRLDPDEGVLVRRSQ